LKKILSHQLIKLKGATRAALTEHLEDLGFTWTFATNWKRLLSTQMQCHRN